MAEGPNVGYAALQIIPSFKGGEAAIAKGLGGAGGAAEKAGGQAASKFGGAFTTALGAAGIGVGIAGAIGVGLFKIGESFDEQFDKIRVGTGETGAALEGLKGDFKNVLSSVPTDFGSAGDAIAALNQKLDLTGPALQERSEQFLELSRITGTDLNDNLTAGTDALKNFGVAAGDQGASLDFIFRASQESGESFSELASTVAQNGPVLRSLGYDLKSGTSFLAGLGKAGVDASQVMPALAKSLSTAAKRGEDASEFFSDTWDAILDAPDATKAAGLAVDAFGAKAGPKLAESIRSGTLKLGDMYMTLSQGSDTIIGAGKDTQDFAEKFDLLKNRVLVGLEPLASGVFDAIGSGMDSLGPIFDTVTSGISTVVNVFKADGLEGIGNLIQDQAPVIGQKLLDLGQKLYEWVQPQIEPMLGKLGDFLKQAVDWILSDGVPMLAEGVKVLIPAITGWLLGDKDKGQDSALAQLMTKAGEFLKAFVAWIVDTDDGLAGAVFEGGKEAGASLASGIWEGLKEGLGSEFSPFGKGYEIHLPGTNVDIPLKAAGGPVNRNMPYIVGEKGPELFRPDNNGTIVPNHQLRLIPGGGEGVGPAASRGERQTHLHVVQYEGESQVDAGMRALRWHDTVEELVGVAR